MITEKSGLILLQIIVVSGFIPIVVKFQVKDDMLTNKPELIDGHKYEELLNMMNFYISFGQNTGY